MIGIAALSWLPLAPGCSGDAATGAVGETVDVPIDSVHVVGTSEQISRIIDVMPGAGGTIWALNSDDPYFMEFDTAGDVVRSWGVRGQGPRDLRAPDGFVRHPARDGVWVYDRNPSRNALIRVDRADDEWSEISFPNDSLPAERMIFPHFAESFYSRIWFRPRGDRLLVARARPEAGEVLRTWHADLVAVGDDGASTVVLPIADLIGDPAQKYAGGRMFLPYPLFDACADGSFVLYDPLRNEVRRFGPDAAEQTPRRLPRERAIEITMERVLDIMFRGIAEQTTFTEIPDSSVIRAQVEAEWGQMSMLLAEVFPEYVDLRCIDDGSVWIQPFDTESGRLGYTDEWLRLRPDGSTDRVVLPYAFFALRFEDDRIWGYLSDDVGVHSVAWISLPN